MMSADARGRSAVERDDVISLVECVQQLFPAWENRGNRRSRGTPASFSSLGTAGTADALQPSHAAL